jgi:hypothetical protein
VSSRRLYALGYGVKTVSCILLLALYRADFPVDVNVGRIMARLGWVPLETEQALEELSEYAPEPAVYKFLRERLNSFGLQTLFELHYHMITLGKVFCEKRMPNCSACPLKDMCEYAGSGGKHLNRAAAAAAAAATAAAERENAAKTAPAAAAPASAANEPPSSSTAPATPAPTTPPAAVTATTMEAAIGASRAVPEVSHSAAAAATAEILEASKTPEEAAAADPVSETPAKALEAITKAGAAWDGGGRPPSGAAAVLGLDPGADWPTARAAHARLSRLVHPDKNSDPRADRAFALITAARNSLAPAALVDDVMADPDGGGPVDDSFRVVDGEVIVGADDGGGGGRGGGGAGAHGGDPSGGYGGGGGCDGDIEDDPSTPEGMSAVAAAATKGFAAAAAAAAASFAASPLQVLVRPPPLNINKIRHELTAWSLPPEMIPAALRQRAPDVDVECYLAVRSGLPAAVAAAEAAGVDIVPLAVLVPCRAAMLAKFPLHGTYFQTNEVFLDAETAARPSLVPAHRLTNLPTVSVYLGSSVASICRGMSRAEVASSFSNRAVCVRSFDPATGHPRPLPRWGCTR